MRFAPAVLASLALAATLGPARAPTHAQAPGPAPAVETWRCERVTHPLVDFHTATLTLAPDATFELRHTHTTPENGWSTWLRGTYARTPTELVLTPVSALRRVWRGDMHRQEHGEDVGATQWEEPVSTTPWHLTRVDHGGVTSLSVRELGTRIYPSSPATPLLPCDGDRPPLRPHV